MTARDSLSTLLLVGSAFFCAGCPSTFPLGHARSAETAPAHVAPQWLSFQSYLDGVTQRAQKDWEHILADNHITPAPGSHVDVALTMNSEGRVSNIASIGGNAGEQAEKACVSALTNLGSYGAWTEEMIAVLGTKQELKFSFFHQ